MFFARTVYVGLECGISREDVGEHAWSTHRHHLYGCQRPPVLTGNLVADHSPRDIKVLSWVSTDLIHSPLIPVNPMAPAREAEVATD